MKERGFDITIASPKGGAAPIDPFSFDPAFTTENTDRFEKDAMAQRALQNTLKLSEVDFDNFDAAFFPGGYGQLWDLASDSLAIKLIKDILKAHGTPRVLIHNPAKLYIKPFEETTEAEFSTAWQSMVLSAFSVAQEVLPKMVEAGEGSYIVSGATASLRGGARFSAFASAKFALRGLTQSLAREYQTKGIHVAHIILDGIIDTEASRELHNLPTEKMMQTDALSQMYWDIAHQPRSVWTHELDLRPSTEGF